MVLCKNLAMWYKTLYIEVWLRVQMLKQGPDICNSPTLPHLFLYMNPFEWHNLMINVWAKNWNRIFFSRINSQATFVKYTLKAIGCVRFLRSLQSVWCSDSIYKLLIYIGPYRFSICHSNICSNKNLIKFMILIFL